MDLNIDSDYAWDGTDGNGGVLGDPCTVTVVGIDTQCTLPVVIRTPDGMHWGVKAKTLSPVKE